ncbi:Dihydrolipoyllysine-residue acetyltransferase component 4 of pyruvate dehydrogenase complex, chloroplastic [Dichanthelium oligosanthes]|uniref:Dihydrolipoamide acetyltransferase component of pyruvate dehydrogenase complex n=1 Tax=Dichanthelium oligosanthes TaxID=888268 RepID=A0A1E5W7G1_9POAL|nr:Dihydrolipoyllysine-residue acetyltransferase component 4 of pyruvate dehydrogenase complex, chloroplastic [Dichanthelium oligosanthes]
MASLASPSLSPLHTVPGRARLAAAGAPRRRRRTAVVRAKVREIFMPALSSTMKEGKIVSWTAAEGDRVAKGDPVVVVESDKADMDVETFHDGIVAAVLVPAGGTAPVGAAIALLAETEEEVALARARAQALSQGQSQEPPPPHAGAAAPAPPPPAPVAAPATKGVATPYAKKLAKQHRVDIAGVVGTGAHGRITAADVEAAAGIKPKPKVAPPPPPPPASVRPAPPAPVASGAVLPPLPGGRVVPFTTMQAAVSRNMVESLSVPTFRVGYSMITDKFDALYEKVKSKGVTKTVLLVKAAAMALTQHPVVNASCRDGKSFSYNTNVNIGVAVALEGGLLTPVLEDADKGAIMAVGASRPTVVADKDGFFSIKSEMLVNVTADHRVIYGADLAAFLQTFAKIVEDPESLTL